MTHIWSIAKKELREFFSSPVAVIFLAAFLFLSLVTVFWLEKFFARNIADIRPLFEWLPVYLIFLIASLTMRMWSEEQKLGTLEILLTLPVPTHRLVLGKFFAGMLLVALALGMTLGFPITVSMIGDIDWGPVVGGYLAALLLAGTYLSIGLCISSLTENMLVSLICTVVACFLLFAPGTSEVTNLFDTAGASILSDLGTGSRFESVARGVLDFRDLLYYVSLTAFFLILNTALLKAKSWSTGKKTAAQRFATKLGVALVLANVVAANVLFAPLASARVDLTENDIYSLSPVTEKILGQASEPLLIRGYFSQKTHPLLAPLVPQIKDLLSEYEVAGDGHVRVEFVDPRTDPDLEKEAIEKYGIKAFPFQFADRHQASVVSSYFHILIKYGDKYEVLTFEDLIEVRSTGIGDVEVGLKNLEYDITRAVKKSIYGFQSVSHMFAALSGQVKLTAFITPDTLPEKLAEVPARLDEVAKELAEKSGGKFVYETVEPKTEAEKQDLYRNYGFQPVPTALLSEETFYFHLLLKVGDKLARVPIPESASKADLEKSITSTIKRVTPGFLKTVGMWVPKAAAAPPMHGRPPQQQRPPQSFSKLGQALAQNYEIRSVDLSDGEVSGEIDVLLLAGPSNLSEKEVRAIDQYLMRGGPVIVLAGRFRLDLGGLPRVQMEPVTTGLADALATYGVKIPQKLVLDEQNAVFPLPRMRNVRGLQVRQVELVQYPFFVLVRQDGMPDAGVIAGGLRGAILHWASPVLDVATKGDGEAATGTDVERRVLLASSDDSWRQEGIDVTSFDRPADLAPEDEGSVPLAVALTGRFSSHFAKEDEKQAEATESESSGPPERTIERSVPDARLVVVGSSSFVSDSALALSMRAGSRQALSNIQLVHNLVDWAVTDTDLLTIRSAGDTTRVLELPKSDGRNKWELINYGIVLVLLGGIVILTLASRKAMVPMQLEPRRDLAGGDDDDGSQA